MLILTNGPFTILIDGRVIAAYSRGKIVLPKSNMLDETRRSRGHLSYSIKGELFGQDYRQQLPYHLIFSCHVLQSWTIPYGSDLLLAAARSNFSRHAACSIPCETQFFFFTFFGSESLFCSSKIQKQFAIPWKLAV
jgi:hypothetical protein